MNDTRQRQWAILGLEAKRQELLSQVEEVENDLAQLKHEQDSMDIADFVVAPPASGEVVTVPQRKHAISHETRKKQSERMKQRWAEKKRKANGK